MSYFTAMTERTTVRLPDDLVRRAKRKAAAEGRSLTALIEAGLRRELNERPRARRAGRVRPPVSSATGGLMPGIDLDDTASLQEMDDFPSVPR
jgi:predicted transcriptional regulator